ncbi:MAG: PQQ-dependent sugar dehydrogenase [Planctomycetaceae bacterium]
MRRATLAALALVIGAGMAWADTLPNTLTEAERRGGWRLLFDGLTTDGFRTYRKDHISPGWVVEDGALVRRAAGAGDLVTADEFAAFELQLEYRIAPGGNSGVMVHVTEDADKPWHSGPEVQIIDNAAGKDPQRAGWLYQLYKPVNAGWARQMEQAAGLAPPDVLDATRPAGEWNHLAIRIAPSGCEVCVNGVVYERFTIGAKDWNERVAKSKFAAFPGFAKSGRGRICLQDHGDEVAFRSIKIRELPTDRPPPWVADGTLAVEAAPAFPGITWEGWSPETDDGKPAQPLRPLFVTHAGDGSGRLFVPDQSGMIHVITPGAKEARLFLDLRPGTAPWTKWNEEGLLGLAFHPRFRENGEFFVCQSVKGEKRLEHVARFRVSKDDPDRADSASGEVVLEIEQPFWNHNGGSIAFGPDGFLYVGLGDGGSRNDPFGHGQRLDVLFGKILRIDVDRRDEGKAYAIPADNPFVGRDNARKEIYALGFRNPWQLAFDPPTGRLWAADVGQDLWEEIDLVVKGGNYGWNAKEGSKAFGSKAAAGPLVDPVWEYDHQVGKSVTGGSVYRGTAIPELVGRYVYGDFVSGRMWALSLDEAGRATANHVIPWIGLPIFGFGADAAGELYVCTSSPTGEGVFKLLPADGPRDAGGR